MKIRLIALTVFSIGAVAIARLAPAAKHQEVTAPEFMLRAGSRTCAIEYVGKISGIPEGAKKLRVWLPVPQNSTVQTIRDLSFSESPRLTTEPKYGNRI